MPGSHWVALCFSESLYAEYFDFYGLPPFKFKIMAYLQLQSNSWIFKRHSIQGLTSNVCGYYRCLYALHTARGISMTSFVNMFIPARNTCKDKRAVFVFRAHFCLGSDCGRLVNQHRQTTNIYVTDTHIPSVDNI